MKNNIFIFGMPRTGTTLVQSLLSTHYGVPNHTEPLFFQKFESAEQALDRFKQQRPASFKILVGQEHWHQTALGLDTNDQLFVCQRKNLTDTCISLHVSLRLGQHHFKTKPDLSAHDPIEVPLEHAHYWASFIYRPFVDMIQHWRTRARPMVEIVYEDVINDLLIDVGGTEIQLSQFPPTKFVNAEINYADLCSNYNEIQSIIQELCS